MGKVIILMMDSFGIGGAPDAEQYNKNNKPITHEIFFFSILNHFLSTSFYYTLDICHISLILYNHIRRLLYLDLLLFVFH